jgi:hypothetical protein
MHFKQNQQNPPNDPNGSFEAEMEDGRENIEHRTLNLEDGSSEGNREITKHTKGI